MYPAGKRIDSSNFNPLSAWLVGAQMAALNHQTEGVNYHMTNKFNAVNLLVTVSWNSDFLTPSGLPMQINTAMFETTGNCGYVVKPEVFREDKCGTFNPFSREPSDSTTLARILSIRVISQSISKNCFNSIE